MENKEIRILLTEDTFSQLCKIGFVSQRDSLGKIDIHFYKNDILELCSGKIVTKIFGEVFKFALQDLGIDMIREMVKRSPIY
jgi:hypothetical protein